MCNWGRFLMHIFVQLGTYLLNNKDKKGEMKK